MPWVSELSLKKRIVDKLRLTRGTLDKITPNMVYNIVATYDCRKKRCCDDGPDCDCVQFGLYDNYITEYEYFIPDK